MQRTILFEAGVTGCKTYRIPALHVTSSGTELAFAEGRSAASDWASMQLVCKRRPPDGEWQSQFAIASSENGPVHNPVPFQGRNGVHLIYGVDYLRFYIVSSADEGQTWSPPREITEAFMGFADRVPVNAIAAGPGGVVVMAGGRIVVPIWLGAGTEANRHGPCRTACIYSDDDGASWHGGGLVEGDLDDPSEAQIALISGDRLLLSIRNRSEGRRRAQAISADGGQSFGLPALANDIADPVCQGSILTLRNGRLAYTGPQSTKRENVCLLISGNEGVSWKNALCLEEGASGYTALAQAQNGDILSLVEVWPCDDRGNMSLALHRIPCAFN